MLSGSQSVRTTRKDGPAGRFAASTSAPLLPKGAVGSPKAESPISTDLAPGLALGAEEDLDDVAVLNLVLLALCSQLA